MSRRNLARRRLRLEEPRTAARSCSCSSEKGEVHGGPPEVLGRSPETLPDHGWRRAMPERRRGTLRACPSRPPTRPRPCASTSRRGSVREQRLRRPCTGTGDAVIIDAANEHELLLEVSRPQACAECSPRTATGTTPGGRGRARRRDRRRHRARRCVDAPRLRLRHARRRGDRGRRPPAAPITTQAKTPGSTSSCSRPPDRVQRRTLFPGVPATPRCPAATSSRLSTRSTGASPLPAPARPPGHGLDTTSARSARTSGVGGSWLGVGSSARAKRRLWCGSGKKYKRCHKATLLHPGTVGPDRTCPKRSRARLRPVRQAGALHGERGEVGGRDRAHASRRTHRRVTCCRRPAPQSRLGSPPTTSTGSATRPTSLAASIPARPHRGFPKSVCTSGESQAPTSRDAWSSATLVGVTSRRRATSRHQRSTFCDGDRVDLVHRRAHRLREARSGAGWDRRRERRGPRGRSGRVVGGDPSGTAAPVSCSTSRAMRSGELACARSRPPTHRALRGAPGLPDGRNRGAAIARHGAVRPDRPGVHCSVALWPALVLFTLRTAVAVRRSKRLHHLTNHDPAHSGGAALRADGCPRPWPGRTSRSAGR